MSRDRPILRIFVSSPGDVAQERALAEGVLRRIGGEFARRVRIEPVFWEHEPLVATDSFQDQLVRPSDTDVVICILWSRLGTRLPARFRRPDGTRYASGTEFEFEDAVEGWKRNGRPDLLVYRKTAEPLVSLLDSDRLLEKLRQREALDAFISRWFHDEEDGSLRAAFHAFDAPEEFEAALERHLRVLVDRRAPPAPAPGRVVDPRPEAPRWTEGSPFRGLEPFDEAHAEVFFGRTGAVSEVLDHLRLQAAQGRPFVVVVGMSGGGKSSLVRAGVLPLLTRPGVVEGVSAWRRCVMRPADGGGDPFLALGAALIGAGALPELAASGSTAADVGALARTSPAGLLALIRAALDRVATDARLVLVVDQFEELFSLKGLSEQERRGFGVALDTLVRSGRVWGIATLRSDLYPRLAELPEVVTLKEGQGQVDLLPPSAGEIGQMIRQPVQAAGLRLEVDPETGERLEDRLIGAAVGRPGSLPLLEFTLEQLYRRRSGDGTLTFDAFRELGGVEGSLAKRAEEVFAALPTPVQEALPAVLRHLVTLVEQGEGTTVAARPAALERVRADEASTRLVDALVDARLLVTDLAQEGGAVVRVAHEALLRHWPRLTAWLDQDQELLKSRARLRAGAFRWAESGRTPDLLLVAGKPLEDARSVVSAGSALTELEADFVAASERRARLFAGLRSLAVAALAVLALVAGVSGWAARRAADRAEAQAYTATRTHEFMVGLLALARPSLAQGRETTVRDLLDSGRDRLLFGELGDVPATAAWAMRDLATSYVALGALDDALTLARAADSLVATDPALPDSVRARGWMLLGEIHQGLGALDSAAVHLERSLDVWRTVDPGWAANAATGLAAVRREQGRLDRYHALMDSATVWGRAASDSTELDFAVVLSNEALRLLAAGDPRRAEELLDRAEGIWGLHRGARLDEYAVLLGHRARARAMLGDVVRADSLFREALEIERRILPDGHPGLAVTLNNLALNAQEIGDTSAAEGWLREAVGVSEQALGPDHPRTAAAKINLGELLGHRPGGGSEAEALLREALDGLGRSAPLNEDVSVAWQNLGALYRFRGAADSALALFRRAFVVDSTAGREADAVAVAARAADVAAALDRPSAAEREVDRAFAAAGRIADPRLRARTLDDLQDRLFNSALFEPSERAAREALELRRLLDAGGSAELANSLADVAWWEAMLGRREDAPQRRGEAEALLSEAEAMLDATPPADPDWAAAHRAVTFALTALELRARVVERERAAAERLRAEGDPVEAVLALFRQAEAEEVLGRQEEARDTYRRASDWAEALLGPGHPLRADAEAEARSVGGGSSGG